MMPRDTTTARRCPSCGSRLKHGTRQCVVCGHGVPFRWTQRGVLLESAAVVGLVVLAALALVLLRSSGRSFVSDQERIVQSGVVDRVPTELPSPTALPLTPSAVIAFVKQGHRNKAPAASASTASRPNSRPSPATIRSRSSSGPRPATRSGPRATTPTSTS